MEHIFKLRENPISYQKIISHISKNQTTSIIIAPIDAKTEELIDILLPNRDDIDLKVGQIEFTIKAKNVCFYGDVDFSDGSEDLEVISKANWLDSLKAVGVKIPSNYDYKTHTCISDIPEYYKIRETFNPADVVQYKHGILGKPKKVIIFKYVTTKGI